MSNLSDFLGGSGGGGDPQATFQAASNITSGDLVALKANGTVESVYSTDVLEDTAQSNDGTKVYAGTTTYYNGPRCWVVHNEATDRYLFVRNEGGGNLYHQISQGTYNDATGQFTLTDSNQVSGYASWLSQKPSPNDAYVWAYGDPTSARLLLRGIYWNGSNYVFTSEANFGYSTGTGQVYAHVNGSGSSSYTVAALSTTNELMVSHGVYIGTSQAPSTTTDLTNRKYSSAGQIWNGNWLTGTHIKDDIHIFGLKHNSTNEVRLVMAKSNSTTTTFGSSLNTTKTESGNYAPSGIAYDPIGNVGIIGFRGSNGRLNLHGFTVDTASLTITDLGAVTTTCQGNMGKVSFNPTANKFVVMDSENANAGRVEFFTYNSSGVQGTIQQENIHPSATIAIENPDMYPVANSNYMVTTFNTGTTITSNYASTGNHLYATQFGVPFIDTNIDDYFGQATEAITSGNAGPVAISNRSVDYIGSSFQKGQKLFANPSGSALATSGTYRVGYATDGDTVLVTGDAS